jgi:hypothetical protein
MFFPSSESILSPNAIRKHTIVLIFALVVARSLHVFETSMINLSRVAEQLSSFHWIFSSHGTLLAPSLSSHQRAAWRQALFSR